MDALTYFKNAEREHRTFVSRRYVIIRLDGKAFHSYTRGLDRPVDAQLVSAMDQTATFLCQEVSGVIFAYTQSDEISLVIDTFDRHGNFEPWLGGGIQKLASITASMATAQFNRVRMEQGFTDKVAYFDARTMDFDDLHDVAAYCDWRRSDAIKNSVSMAAYAIFPESKLDGKNTSERMSMLFNTKNQWGNLPEGFRFGRFTHKAYRQEWVTFVHGKTKEEESVLVWRSNWVTTPATCGFNTDLIVERPEEAKIA
ncbi:MAG: tRNA(His) guanylyltransferase Thg1 family protein [Enterococcus sp.]|nr:tRNA(His) guanylyltransferase Thg1 family protein [Enterococcus sp.]